MNTPLSFYSFRKWLHSQGDLEPSYLRRRSPYELIRSSTIFIPTLILFLFTFSNCGKKITPVSNGKISVKGNQIVDQQGKVLNIAGPSFFWSNTGWGAEKFYTANAVKWAKDFQQAKIVRAALGVDGKGGYLLDPSNKKRITTVVDAAIEEGVYVIIDWHSHHAEDHTELAVHFFTEMAKKYGEYDNVIYEIYNEPLDISWSNVLKPYLETVCKAIRKHDSDNLIIVGTPNWSQDVDVASKDPITKFDNIAYAFHFYAGTHRQNLRDKVITALDNGIPIFVTEWGTINANGDGDINQTLSSLNEWLDFLAKYELSHCNWAFNDKKEGASMFKPKTNPDKIWTEDDLTNSGLKVTEIIKNWNQN